MLRHFYLLLALLLLFSCANSDAITPETSDEDPKEEPTITDDFYNAIDISYYPQIVKKGLTFYNRNGTARNFLQILKENNVNTIRLRLWHNPINESASFEEVALFSKELKRLNFKVCLTVHYSDTWADPGNQIIPNAWKNASYTVLKDSVYKYTTKIMEKISPDIIQIGNEIDSGILLPIGDINKEKQQFLGLLSEGIKAVRNNNAVTKIMIHKADVSSAKWFFNNTKSLNFDFIGLSYYPKWHGKDLENLKNNLVDLNNSFPQKLFLAETSYPFTLNWNDNVNNVIGDNSEIIYPEFPATLAGQKAYLSKIKTIVKSIKKGVGLGYWGAEWVSFESVDTSIKGSPYENQALFDFDLKATPAIEVFKE